jgi:hypothetical protein
MCWQIERDLNVYKKSLLLISLWKSEWARERTADLGLFGRRICKDWMYENREKKKSIGGVHTSITNTAVKRYVDNFRTWYRNVCILSSCLEREISEIQKFRNKLYLMLIRTDGTRLCVCESFTYIRKAHHILDR